MSTVKIGTTDSGKPCHRMCHYWQGSCFVACCGVCRQPYAETDYNPATVNEILGLLRLVKPTDLTEADGTTMRERLEAEIARFESALAKL